MTDEWRELPAEIEAYVRQFAVRRRRLAVLRRVGLGVSVSVLFAFVSCLADRVFRLSGDVRAVLLGCAVGILVVPVVWPVVRLLRGVDYLRTAGRIERGTGRFGQRLQTLVSQYRLPKGERGSEAFLETLRREVSAEIGQVKVARLLPWTRAAGGPWFMVVLTAGLVVVGSQATWLGMPQLAARLAMPHGDVPPVTTTRVLVSPGPASVVEGEALTIQAKVSPLPDVEVVLRVERSATVMQRSAAGGGVYEVTVPRVDREFAYAVEAGDAVSPAYEVEVLRRPAVSELRVRYEFPAYARREPATVVSRDGIVEAPVGTRAVVQVVGTEPLDRGALVSPEGRVELAVTEGDARVAEGAVEMKGDQRYQVELVSARGVAGQGGTRVLVRSVADRGPAVRVVQPVDDLRLDPHAVLPVGYEAVDDIGVARVSAHVRVNGGEARDVPVLAAADGRRVEGVYDLDLAGLELKVGDVLGVSVSAADGLGQVARSEERHVLITPRTIDIATYQRLAELKQAAQVAQVLVGALEGAERAYGELVGARPGADRLKKLSALNQQLAGAAEAQAGLRRAVMGAVARSDSAGLSNVLAGVADALAVCTWQTARASARVSVGRGEGEEIRERIAGALAGARGIREKVGAVALGQQAAATLADRANLRVAATVPTTQSTAERVRRTLERARADVTAAARALGMDVSAPDLDARLQQLVDAAEKVMRDEGAVDYAAVVGAWGEGLEERLEAAAGVEGVRADGDAAWAGDLQLAARVVRGAREGEGMAEVRAGLGEVVGVLQGAHRAGRAAGATRPVAEVVEARGRLRRWAGEGEIELSAVEAIDRQARGVGQGAVVGGEGTAGVIREVQEALAAMPGDLARLLSAVEAERGARVREEEVRREAASAPAERQGEARRRVEQAESVRAGARESVESAARALAPSVGEELSLRLRGVGGEQIADRLAPALRALRRAVESPGEGAGIGAAADLTREAIGQVQADLRRVSGDGVGGTGQGTQAGGPSWVDGAGRLTLSDPNVVPYSGAGRREAVRGADAPGYGEALEAYFRAISKEGGRQ